MGGEGVSSHETVHIAVLDHRLHRTAGVRVKGEGGTHHPEDVSVLFLVFEQLEEAVIVSGVGCLAASSLTEDELVAVSCLRILESRAVEVDPFFCILCPADDDLVSDLEIAVFDNLKAAVIAEDDAGIHPAFLSQSPFPADFEILGIHGGAVIVLGSDALDRYLLPGCIW